MIAKSHQWRLNAIALAVVLGLWGGNAAALSLGRISVQSALGEPLKAEIDVLDINAEETASFSSKAATPEAFKAAGLDYHAAMANLQTSLQRRANGRSFIRLSSDRAINDPFVDLVLEVSWSSGRVVRDYTLLFDPPNLRDKNMAVPTLRQLPGAATAQAGAPAPSASREQPSASPNAAETKKPKAVVLSPSKPSARPDGQTVTVKAGDTAGRIAAANKPASVSLDQMLVALLRANPDAFIKDNVNRIKTGSVLALPTEEQAASVSDAEASQVIIAQSQDFNDFRRKFASSAPLTSVEPVTRDVSGKVQATVQDKKPVPATSDKLTLSKGAVAGKTSEEQLAQAKSARDAASRSAELTKNISDLSKLAAVSGPALAVSASPAVSQAVGPAIKAVPAVSAPSPAPTASMPTPAASMSAPMPAASAAASAPKPAVPAAKKPASAAPVLPAPVAEPGFIDALLENPLLPVGAAGLLALLAGLGIYKFRKRKEAAPIDSSFIEASPDSFLGVSGGQVVDTSDSLTTTGSSMVYSPSQLDDVDEVDPVAEADVYLAYGRDLQAEEILKNALRDNPKRLAIHHKLLEIYAKRHDATAFEAIATQAFNLTDGSGSDWEQICDKGLTIDPDNALYLPGGQPFEKPSPLTGPAPLDAESGPPTIPFGIYGDADPQPAASAVDIDLDFEFSIDEPSAAQSPEATEPLPSTSTDLLEMPPSLDFPEFTKTVPHSIPEPEPEPDPTDDLLAEGLDFSLADSPPAPEFELAAPQVPTSTPANPAPPADADMMSFDLGSLSLDLTDEPVTVAGSLAPEGQDPLDTKLALADEFRAIGDDDGARALIEEVIAEATGEMKAKAQRALSRL